MWIKLLISAFIIAFCIFLGWFAAEKYRNRRKFFSAFLTFNERYLGELGFQRRPLATAVKEYGSEGDFGKSLSAYVLSRKVSLNYAYLTEDERKYCVDYFSMLGRSDAKVQSAYFTAQAGELQGRKTDSESECKKRGELYLKLGLLAGLAFVILIV